MGGETTKQHSKSNLFRKVNDNITFLGSLVKVFLVHSWILGPSWAFDGRIFLFGNGACPLHCSSLTIYDSNLFAIGAFEKNQCVLLAFSLNAEGHVAYR